MTDGAGEGRQNLADAHGRRLRHGLRQAELVKQIIEHRTAEADGDLAAAINVTRRTAAFVEAEGWAQGPAWTAYGAQWLLAMWALAHGYTSEEVNQALETATQSQRDSREGGAAPQTTPRDSQEPSQERRRAAAEARRRRATRLRRGREQVAALGILIRHIAKDGTDLSHVVPAARHAATFADAESWVTGSLWSAYGMQLLLSRWALDHDTTHAEIAEHFAAHINSTDDE